MCFFLFFIGGVGEGYLGDGRKDLYSSQQQIAKKLNTQSQEYQDPPQAKIPKKRIKPEKAEHA